MSFTNKSVNPNNGNASYEQIRANVLDLSSSNGVYRATSSENTITLNNEVQFADIRGGVLAEDTKKITFDFQGAPQGKKQALSFGSDVGAPNSQLIQAEANGEIRFNFSGGENNLKRQSYILLANTVSQSGSSIVNSGTMSFNVGAFSDLDFNCGNIVNSGEMNFDFYRSTEIWASYSSSPKPSIITESGGVTSINFHQASRTSYIYWHSEVNIKSSGETTLSLNNSYVYMIAPQLIGVANNKKGLSITLEKKSNIILGSRSMQNVSLVFKDAGNTVYSFGSLENITWLDNTNSNANNISLATNDLRWSGNADGLGYRNIFRVLEIGNKNDSSGASGISGDNLNFIVYANLEAKAGNGSGKTPTIGGQDLNGAHAYSDRVIIHSSQGNRGGNHNLGVVFSMGDLSKLSSIAYHNQSSGDIQEEGNIAVASVAKASRVSLNAMNGTLLGFNLVKIGFEEKATDYRGIITGDNLQDTYTTYFLKSAQDTGVAPITQEVTSSVFALNYDLFIANFNSLNKRMGDLRNNPYSQGAWGRIFNGQLSNDFGLGSSSNYTTLQAGYDYDFSLSNAKNYLGVALAYGFSISEMSSNASNALQSREIKDIFSNNIELALYNAYVEDSGLYSDSIAKFSYLMSDFNLTNNGASESLNVNNYAFQLSEEVGYVFTLGSAKEWSITPQAELSFGYYSDSDLTQVAGDFYLDAKAKSLMMLRARVGAMVGYDFKQYAQDVNATLYTGLSYEYDYLNGGDIELTPNIGKATTTKSALSSDGRGVLNLGTNITFKDDIRLYADFQTSFGGKINTDYQINIGARFSFGEKGESRVEDEDKNVQ